MDQEIGWIQILLLAIIQGITEFLPISSSGHLILLPLFMELADQGLVIDIAAHFGTLCAVCIYFRDEVKALFRGFTDALKTHQSQDFRLFWYMIVGTLPIVFVGFLFKTYIETALRSPLIIGYTMIGWGLVLGLADKLSPQRREINDLKVWDALIIGCFQVLALVPGTSRSGITMTASRLIGMTRVEGARFSLLLSIPTILAAVVLALGSAVQADLPLANITFVAVAFLSFLVAYATLKLLMSWLRFASFTPFVVYRLALGGLIFYWFW